VDQYTKDNWTKIKAHLEQVGQTDNMFYKRAVAICAGGKDLIKDEGFDFGTNTLPGVGNQT